MEIERNEGRSECFKSPGGLRNPFPIPALIPPPPSSFPASLSIIKIVASFHFLRQPLVSSQKTTPSRILSRSWAKCLSYRTRMERYHTHSSLHNSTGPAVISSVLPEHDSRSHQIHRFETLETCHSEGYPGYYGRHLLHKIPA